MFLSNKDILECMEKGLISIKPFNKKALGPASYDLALSDVWWVFKKRVNLIDTKSMSWKDVMKKLRAKSITLKPQEMCLGLTKERIKLANNIVGRLEGRSRYARIGLGVHITSALMQPGINNRQVLEIINNSPYPIKLYAGMRISQVMFAFLNKKTTKPYAKYGKIAVNQ